MLHFPFYINYSIKGFLNANTKQKKIHNLTTTTSIRFLNLKLFTK